MLDTLIPCLIIGMYIGEDEDEDESLVMKIPERIRSDVVGGQGVRSHLLLSMFEKINYAGVCRGIDAPPIAEGYSADDG